MIASVIFSVVLGLFVPSQAWSEENMIFSVNSLSELKVGQYPSISGMAKDSQDNPLPNVEVQVNFPSRIMTTTTDSDGKFTTTSPISAEVGKYTVTIYATKGTMSLKTQVTYDVVDKQNVKIYPDKKISDTKNYDNSKYDLFSRTILDKIEEQKTENNKKEALSNQQQNISEQRLQIDENLQDAVKSFAKENESQTPRNAFLKFLAHIDHSVKDIFWHQFLFTEKRTDDARIAKENALQIGKSSLEATRIFQQEAAISQNEIIEYNDELNIKYGNATSSNIQK